MLHHNLTQNKKFLWTITIVALVGLFCIFAAINQVYYLRRLNQQYFSIEAIVLVKLNLPCTENKEVGCYSYRIRFGNSEQIKYTNETTKNYEIGDQVTAYYKQIDDKYFDIEKPVHNDYANVILPALSLGSCFVLLGAISLSLKVVKFLQSKRSKKS